uniref:BC061194 protein n=1 Tax=Mus musculus TaxID=10090 RepID=Q810Q4_MOUSE|nr:BC061194 protein [Mus musculus]
MSQRQVLQVFELYQNARTRFVQMVAEQATKPQNIETLQNAGIMSLLRPLLLDVVPTIQQTAALALGRLANYNDDLAAAWALGQVGRHTPEHARAVAITNTLPVLLALYMSPESSEDLQVKSKKAIKNIIQKCTYLPALEPFLYDAPPNILKYVAGQFSKVLPHDSKARRLFVTSGGLKKIQEIKAEPGSILQEYINNINSCYPEEIVRYYSPGYSDILL